jgi:hypothetical protein
MRHSHKPSSVCVCVCVCNVPVYLHTVMYACIHTYMYAYIHTCMHAHIHVCIHTYMYAYIHVCNIHTCMHAYIHVCIHTYIHTYIYPCIHTVEVSGHTNLSIQNDRQIPAKSSFSACREHLSSKIKIIFIFIIQNDRQIPAKSSFSACREHLDSQMKIMLIFTIQNDHQEKFPQNHIFQHVKRILIQEHVKNAEFSYAKRILIQEQVNNAQIFHIYNAKRPTYCCKIIIFTTQKALRLQKQIDTVHISHFQCKLTITLLQNHDFHYTEMYWHTKKRIMFTSTIQDDHYDPAKVA